MPGASVAVITAIPAPCGVGTRWEDRAFGFASAWRSKSGLIAQIMHADSTAARTMAQSEGSNSETVISFEARLQIQSGQDGKPRTSKAASLVRFEK